MELNEDDYDNIAKSLKENLIDVCHYWNKNSSPFHISNESLMQDLNKDEPLTMQEMINVCYACNKLPNFKFKASKESLNGVFWIKTMYRPNNKGE